MTRDVTPIPKLGPKKKPAKKRKPKSYMAQADTLWAAIIHLKFDRCQFCGRTDGKLDAHHVMIRGFKATRTDTSQGLLLCFQCHQNVAHGDPFGAVLEYERIFGHEGYRALREKARAGIGAKYPPSFWRERVAALEVELVAAAGSLRETQP